MMTLAQFDARYHVEAVPEGWAVKDTQERKLEAGPWRSKETARQALHFMRAHVGVLYVPFK